MNAASLELAKHAFEDALFGHADGDVILALGREYGALQEQDRAVKAKHLRTKAIDLRAAYARHMADYGREIGRASNCKDPTIATLVRSAANAALDVASDCLTQALAAEEEARRLDANGFVKLFDGVSAKISDITPRIRKVG